ncbi:MAG: N-acetyl-gamma-glutamyl-phosphate reductase [Alkalispirochaetaceae bacterium]
MKVAVLGATGYTGALLVRILAHHPEVSEILAVSSSRPGESVRSQGTLLSRQATAKLASTDGRFISVEAALAREPEAVFSALPHLTSAAVCAPFLGTSVVIDLSADFRHRDRAYFERAYSAPPPREELLSEAVYGLTEFARDSLRSAGLIATPGCYPTSSLLPLLPLAAAGILEGMVVINSMSGISGAGRKAKENLLLAERSENVNAYSPGRSHRHLYEIEEQLRAAGGWPGKGEPPLLFTPHLVPIKQGMASTIMVATEEVERGVELLESRYAAEPFVEVIGERVPETIEVRGTNRALIGYRRERGSLLIFSVLDNLWKGASGQAVQNFNVRFGFDETAGLILDAEV